MANHLPRSTTSPSLRTRMQLAWVMVERRCATMIVVLSTQTFVNASYKKKNHFKELWIFTYHEVDVDFKSDRCFSFMPLLGMVQISQNKMARNPIPGWNLLWVRICPVPIFLKNGTEDSLFEENIANHYPVKNTTRRKY
jgi:hypothetical protein